MTTKKECELMTHYTKLFLMLFAILGSITGIIIIIMLWSAVIMGGFF